MKESIVIGLLSLFIVTAACRRPEIPEEPRATDGTLDARDWSFDNGSISLSGEWELYWQRFVPPAELSGGTVDPDTVLRLPGLWEGITLDGTTLPRSGYATLRLRALMPPDDGPYAIAISGHTQPIVLYVNGERRAAIGRLAMTEHDLVGYDVLRHIASLGADESALDIVLHISNFHYRQNAGRHLLYIGRASTLARTEARRRMIDFVLIGACFVMALYHGAFFLSDRQARHNLWFAIICLGLTLRWLAPNSANITTIVSDMSWLTRIKMNRAMEIVAAAGLPLYLRELFPSEVHPRVVRLSCVMWALSLAFLVSLGAESYLRLAPWHQRIVDLLYVATLLYICAIIVTAGLRHREGAQVSLVGMLALSAVALYEIHGFYATPGRAGIWYHSLYALVPVMLSQSVVNTLRHTHLRREAETLRDALPPLRRRLLTIHDKRELIDRYLSRIPGETLTPREKEIVLMIVEGKKNREIAEELYISYHTVRRHINNINRKLNVTSREGLVERLQTSP